MPQTPATSTPLRPAPRSSASPLPPRRLIQDVAALVHCGVENGHTTGLVAGWDLVRVDDGLAVDGVREVLHAVVANALGEPRGHRLLLGSPLCAQSARWLQGFARVDGLHPHLSGYVDPEVDRGTPFA